MGVGPLRIGMGDCPSEDECEIVYDDDDEEAGGVNKSGGEKQEQEGGEEEGEGRGKRANSRVGL